MAEEGTSRYHVTVVVLGDLGRSPRMQYHALALAAELTHVDLVGYDGSELPWALARNEWVRVHRLPPPRPLDPRRGPRIWLDAAVRLLSQTVRLTRALWGVRKPDLILVQNPPTIPTLGVAWIAARLRGARLVVDWHNLGYTLSGLKLGPRHPLVTLSRCYERTLGRLADAHLCVSRAMAEELMKGWGFRQVTVLYDRPIEIVAPTPPHLRHVLFRRLQSVLGDPPSLAESTAEAGGFAEPTLFTSLRVPQGSLRGEIARYLKAGDGEVDPPPDLLSFVQLRADRPVLMVSPTSWTQDEDFTLLLDAVVRYEEAAKRRRLPRLMILVTGQGPLREGYEARFRELPQRQVQVRAVWLGPEDFRRLLGAADLGLCLHRSSSGLDLPMKLADLQGAGLPMCILDYGPVLAERVRVGDPVFLFRSGEELAERWVKLLEGFPGGSRLEGLGAGARFRSLRGWLDGWNQEARPVVAPLLEGTRRRGNASGNRRASEGES